MNGDECVECHGNTIKSLPGNETDYNMDTACDGESAVANDNHTACGKQKSPFAMFKILHHLSLDDLTYLNGFKK